MNTYMDLNYEVAFRGCRPEFCSIGWVGSVVQCALLGEVMPLILPTQWKIRGNNSNMENYITELQH